MKSRLIISLSHFRFWICLLFVFLDFGFIEPVMAQSVGLAISPPVIEVLLSPNKKLVHAFNLINQGESGNFVANIHLATPIDSEGHVTIDPTPIDPSSIPLTISMSNADRKLGEPFPLLANQSTQLVIEIEGANTDTSIDTYLALVISPTLNQITNGTQPLARGTGQLSSTVPAISSLILATLTPDGNLPIKLSIEGFDLPLLHDSTQPLTLNPSVKNTSDSMLRSGGELTITSPRSNHSESIKLYPNLTLSHSSRLVKALIEDPNSPSQPQSQDLIYQPNWHNIGPYQFELTITTEGDSQITQITKTVWLLPIRAIITTILLAIIATSLLVSARTHKSL